MRPCHFCSENDEVGLAVAQDFVAVGGVPFDFTPLGGVELAWLEHDRIGHCDFSDIVQRRYAMDGLYLALAEIEAFGHKPAQRRHAEDVSAGLVVALLGRARQAKYQFRFPVGQSDARRSGSPPS